ncbi:MAG TPA: M23 family metallopeptidase, partial [Chitinophagales bacterium]|nr:M23 family metallopeptidase [Chitinophagales bacterium]
RSPLDIPLILAGTFGEIRVSHFHSGIDIKTNGKTGLPVYAVASGFVSRIKISKTAYGKALYLEHPNGYTTVYAHLQNFSARIEQYIREVQYKKESFEVDEYLPAGVLTVERGEVVAFSGNSGRSAAPHLHFEVRDTKTEMPLNPLAFLTNVTDAAAPVLSDLFLYPMSKSIGRFFPQKEKIIKNNGSYDLTEDTLRVGFRKVGFGINAYDFVDGKANQNGIYELTLKAGWKTVYHFAMNTFSFSETRYVQSHMDYQAKEKNDITVHRCYRLPGNILPLYDTVLNSGIVELDSENPRSMTIIAKDFYGNSSELNFFVLYDASIPPPDFSAFVYDTVFDYRDDNTFQTDEVKVFLPKNACYDSVFFNYEKLSEPDSGRFFSSVHQIHTEEEPAHLYFNLYIKPLGLPESLKSKALIVRGTENPDKPEPKESVWEGKYLKARTRDFGRYYIVADTLPPKIEPLNIYNNKVVTAQSAIQIKITDNLSGIKSYRGTVDGKWILFEYDEKNDLLTYFFDWRTPAGEHNLTLYVTDNAVNESYFQIKFTR